MDVPISGPTNFRHAAHIGVDGTRVSELRAADLPDEYIQLFLDAGVTKDELNDPDVVEFALSHVLQWLANNQDMTAAREIVCERRRARLQEATCPPPSRVEPSLRIDPKDLVFSQEVVGRGASCEVLKASYLGTQVAVKRFYARADDGMLPLVEREVGVLSLLRHPFVVLCLGAVLSPGQPPCILLELMEGGSILNALGSDTFTLARKMDCMSQIARALAYLHSRQPAIIHRDVKPSNILLSADLTCAKLADFGVSKTVEATLNATMTGNVGTPEYCAPEVFDPQEGLAVPAAKIDVYSFSVTLHHVLTNQKPFAECPNAMRVMFAAAGGRRPDVNALPVSLRQIVARGWDASAANRPTMQDMLVALNPAVAVLAWEEQERREDATKCVICIDRSRTHVLIPCGHLCVCDTCGPLQVCPICRAAVLSCHHVFQ